MRNYLLAPLFLMLVACDNSETSLSRAEQSKPDAGAADTTKENAQAVFGNWGVDLTARDESVKPGDDFFRYVNGAWLDSNEIPPERTSYGVSLIVHERAQQRVRDIIEELGEKSGAKGTPEQKVGDYYASWMDTQTVNKLGIKPLQADLDRIAGIENTAALTAEFGKQYYVGGISPITTSLGVDPSNPDKYNINIGLSGMGLPDRDYYLEDSERFDKIRGAYLTHIAEMLDFAGMDGTSRKAESILELETSIARYQWIRSDRRDRDKTYNPTTVKNLDSDYAGFDWKIFLTSAGHDDLAEVNVSHPDTISPLIELINTLPLLTWKTYLTYHMISNHASLLSEEIDTANFNFWEKEINGLEKPLQRWKRGVGRVGAKTGLGEALGQIYVERHFHESSKKQMQALVENMRKAYGERIDALTWMSDATKKEARVKLAAFRAKIGYPDQWLDLDAIVIEKDDLFGNALRIRTFFEDYDVARLKRPTDREEWFMMPQTVNAYYFSAFNEIVFPAAYLTAPYFDPAADPAVNYGAIGTTIGHEMGHGFDDQGSKSDARGVKRNWWTDEDRNAFETRTTRLGEQFDKYEALPGHFVDGKFTMGENIGDLGGLVVAYHAYQLSLNGSVPPVIDGLTGVQRFFLANAQKRRTKLREEVSLRYLKSDPHSPNKFRVNGVVRNVDEWYSAFNIQQGDALYLPPEERVSIW
ncbi:MAG: M13 family metallopeptidase [Gammaproteobacteria bacterium]|nr:M13 family metallopeptidase [Gammaproteobacteria bacterium]